jgi:hypothetical protein
VLARAFGPPDGSWPVRTTPRDGVVNGVSEYPLTDVRHGGVARSGQGTFVLGLVTTIARMTGRSPRESRITVPLGLPSGQDGSGAPAARRRIDRLAQPFETVKPSKNKEIAISRPCDGGDEGTRTPDPLLAKEVLSQLSYIPIAAPIVSGRLVARNAPQRKTTVR